MWSRCRKNMNFGEQAVTVKGCCLFFVEGNRNVFSFVRERVVLGLTSLGVECLALGVRKQKTPASHCLQVQTYMLFLVSGGR